MDNVNLKIRNTIRMKITAKTSGSLCLAEGKMQELKY